MSEKLKAPNENKFDNANKYFVKKIDVFKKYKSICCHIDIFDTRANAVLIASVINSIVAIISLAFVMAKFS